MSRIRIFAVLLLAVAWPRLVLLGDFPHMDEGIFDYLTVLSHQALADGQPLPMMHGLPLEAVICSWVLELPGFYVLWLRLLDLLFALAFGYLLCRILLQECPVWGLALALLVLPPLNSAPVIDAGYKNPIPIAFCFLLGAFCLILRSRSALSCWLAGVLAGIAVLLREPFAIFALLGLAAIWSGCGFRRALAYICGGLTAIAGLLLFLFCVQGPGGLEGYLAAYFDRGLIYAQESGRVRHNFFSGLYKSWHTFTGILVFFAALLLVWLWRLFQGRAAALWRGQLFWTMATLLPLLEPASKIGFLYHFSVCLPGLAGLCACMLRSLNRCDAFVRDKKRWQSRVLPGTAFASLMLALSVLPSPGRLAMTFDMLAAREPGWPDKYTEQSNTLAAASAIRLLLPEGGTLASSGMTFFLYGATGAMPPQKGDFPPQDKYRLSDMSRSWGLLHGDGEAFARELAAIAPDVLAVGKAMDIHEKDYAEEIRAVIDKSGMYELAKVIEANPDKDYGWMSYYLYRKLPPQPAP